MPIPLPLLALMLLLLAPAAAAAAAGAPACPSNFTVEHGFGLSSDTKLKKLEKVQSTDACCAACIAAGACAAWTYHPAGTHSALECSLSTAGHIRRHTSKGAVSGHAGAIYKVARASEG
jgi:hypothetical protein